MSTRKRTRFNSKPAEAIVDNTEAPEETVVETQEENTTEVSANVETPEITETPEPSETVEDAKAPVESELKNDEDAKPLAPAKSAESIQAEIKSKLLSKSTEGSNDLFNPAAVNATRKVEVQALADEAGFALNRGREIGARLMARAKSKP